MPWQSLPDRAQILAVHAAYMGFGQILYFSGNQHDQQHSQTGDIDAARLFDCGSFAVTYTGSPAFDTFCCGHAFLRSGNEVRLLAAGGTELWVLGAGEHHVGHWPGLRDAAVYRSPNFVTPTGSGWEWEEAARMNTAPTANIPNPDPERTGGRWYPTLTTLPNGDVMALSGHPGSSTEPHNNDLPEVFSPEPPPRGRWRRLGAYGSQATVDHYEGHRMILYPRVHLIPSQDYPSGACPSGEFLISSPINRATFTVRPDVGPHSGDFACVCPFETDIDDDGHPDPIEGYGGYSSTSVLLPLRPGDDPNDPDGWQPNGYEASVLICGGENPQPFRLDLPGWKHTLTNPERCRTAGPWKWRKTARRETGRRRVHANATILPTGEVLVTGGIDASGPDDAFDEDAVREPELFDPYNDKWTLLNDPAPLGLHGYGARNYHSVALLMPDGRVWVAGSSMNHESGLENANLDIDVYEPWYHSDPGRPHVTAAPSLAYPGEAIPVRSTHADEIERIVLVRCGSCTHAFNSDQRLIELRFNHVMDDIFVVTMPPNNTVMPPGPYYIFTIRHKDGTLGLPSNGADIYIVPERDPERGRPHG